VLRRRSRACRVLCGQGRIEMRGGRSHVQPSRFEGRADPRRSCRPVMISIRLLRVRLPIRSYWRRRVVSAQCGERGSGIGLSAPIWTPSRRSERVACRWAALVCHLPGCPTARDGVVRVVVLWLLSACGRRSRRSAASRSPTLARRPRPPT
jgi:hypothetical protein